VVVIDQRAAVPILSSLRPETSVSSSWQKSPRSSGFRETRPHGVQDLPAGWRDAEGGQGSALDDHLTIYQHLVLA
jgi:hypothetical protein